MNVNVELAEIEQGSMWFDIANCPDHRIEIITDKDRPCMIIQNKCAYKQLRFYQFESFDIAREWISHLDSPPLWHNCGKIDYKHFKEKLVEE